MSSAGLGQLVTYQQAGQQPGQKIVPQIVQQQPRLPGQPIQQTVQVVQQLNNSGQIVQQVNQLDLLNSVLINHYCCQVVQVPQGQIIQAQQQPGQPGSAVGPLVAGQTASNSGHILQQQSMGQLTALGMCVMSVLSLCHVNIVSLCSTNFHSQQTAHGSPGQARPSH